MSTNPCELWVSIVEKAYMKLNGGYDFPGSNSGIDLYALTGWIPEQIFFEESKCPPSQSSSELSSSSRGKATVLDHKQSETRAWERLKSAHAFGDCLVTISTSDSLSAEQEAATGLVPGHAYAVLDVKEAGILKMLKVPIVIVMHPYHACRQSAAMLSSANHAKTLLRRLAVW
jgi:calpain-7